MIRTTPQRRYHVSNRAAMLAALLLVLTSFTGLSGNSGADRQFANGVEAAVPQANEQATSQTSNKRKLNLSLLLIGRG